MSARPDHFRKPPHEGELGFTLIEILVVLVIVGILVSVAFLSFGILSDDRSLEREARRLTSLMQIVSDEATTQGRDFGIEFMTSGYRFVEHDPLVDNWYEVVGDDYLTQRNLDDGVAFELVLEGKRIELHTEAAKIAQEDKDDTTQRDLTDDYLPHILILSSGDISPFELRFVRFADRASLMVSMDAAGELKIGEDDATAP